jgi:peptidyl-prolyl cis-trans isomerase A (cyclophilin A)
MRARDILALVVVTLGGCQPALLEERNDLRADVVELKDRLQASEDQVHGLERDLDTCQQEVGRRAVRSVLAEVNVDPDAPLHAVLQTSMGDIRVELYPASAPRTVASFVGLAEGSRDWMDRSGALRSGEPLYRDLLFHRVIAGHVIQTGDPLGDGTGTPGYAIPDEFTDDLWFGDPGMLGMANSGPDSNGSQFFITLDEARHLNNRHTVFGKVVDGMDVVRAIAAAPVGAVARFRPDRDLLLDRIVIERE